MLLTFLYSLWFFVSTGNVHQWLAYDSLLHALRSRPRGSGMGRTRSSFDGPRVEIVFRQHLNCTCFFNGAGDTPGSQCMETPISTGLLVPCILRLVWPSCCRVNIHLDWSCSAIPLFTELFKGDRLLRCWTLLLESSWIQQLKDGTNLIPNLWEWTIKSTSFTQQIDMTLSCITAGLSFRYMFWKSTDFRLQLYQRFNSYLPQRMNVVKAWRHYCTMYTNHFRWNELSSRFFFQILINFFTFHNCNQQGANRNRSVHVFSLI
jgi:hypothetical protein